MDGSLRLLVADANEDFRIMVTNAANNEGWISQVHTAADGDETIRLVHEFRPDVLLLDIILPKTDGLFVLESLDQMPDKPAVVVNSGFMSHALEKRCSELGAAIIVIKPCEMDVLLSRVKFAHESKNRPQSSETVEPNIIILLTETMQKIGFAAHYRGYYYLREAVLMSLRKDCYGSCITKVIYPEVAKRFATTPSRVERSIRTMVDKTWENGGALNMRRALGLSLVGKRLTNSEIIAILAEHIRLKAKAKHTG